MFVESIEIKGTKGSWTWITSNFSSSNIFINFLFTSKEGDILAIDPAKGIGIEERSERKSNWSKEIFKGRFKSSKKLIIPHT